MSAGRGPLPWTGTAARTREIGYGQAMMEIGQLVRELLNQVPDTVRGTEFDDAAGPERLAMNYALALSRIGAYAESASLLTCEPALTIGDRWALGDGFGRTFTAMFGGER